MTEQYDGIVNPPIDSLLERVDSKYALVLFAARRARQINAYYSQLHEGLFEYVGPLVDTKLNEKPLSISLREIDADLLVSREAEDPQPLGSVDFSDSDFTDAEFGDFALPGGDDPFATEPAAEAGDPAVEAAQDAAEPKPGEAGSDEAGDSDDDAPKL